MTRVAFVDIETDGLDHWGGDRDAFFRIGGVSVNGGPAEVLESREAWAEEVQRADLLVGHNIMAFDLPAVFGNTLDLIGLAVQRKVLDTWLVAPLVDQAPHSYLDRDGKPRIIAGKPERMKPFYRLDNLSFRYGVSDGKGGVLRDLAKEFGGYGEIPKDDERYRRYLLGDVRDAVGVFRALAPHVNDYAWREQIVGAITSTITVNGFRLDQDLARTVIRHNNDRNARTLAALAERYGVPLVDGKGRPRAAPLSSKAGKQALVQAFEDLGMPPESLPKTGKKAHSFAGEALQNSAADYSQEVQELARAVAEINGTRTVFQTALDHVQADGFCHPTITMLQRTGRTSVQDPGLTVFGKHGGRHRERAIFVPDILAGEADELDTHVLFAADLAQMDSRCVAACSQDHAYLDLFLPGVDSHAEVAHMVWGDRRRRNDAKPLSHGTNYGMGPRLCAVNAGVPLEVAQHFQDEMKRLFPGVERWKAEVRAHGEQHGWVDNGWGRRIRVDPDRVYTQAPAAVGQGATRDVLMDCALKLWRVDPRLVGFIKAAIHDEFIFSVPRRYAEEVRHLVVATMSGEWAPPGASRPVPVLADASPFATRWSGCYEKAA